MQKTWQQYSMHGQIQKNYRERAQLQEKNLSSTKSKHQSFQTQFLLLRQHMKPSFTSVWKINLKQITDKVMFPRALIQPFYVLGTTIFKFKFKGMFCAAFLSRKTNLLDFYIIIATQSSLAQFNLIRVLLSLVFIKPKALRNRLYFESNSCKI